MKSLKDVNWNQVYCFYEVARLQSMTEAAKVLGISTPTISEQVGRLESHLGMALFKRRSRGLQITDEGHTLFTCAREMFEAGSRFLDVVTHDAIGGYTARVGIHEAAAIPSAFDFVARYWDDFSPFGTVTTSRELYFESLLEGLLRGRLDWALTLEEPRSQRLDHRPVATQRFVFSCARQALGQHGSAAATFENLPLIRTARDKSINQQCDEQLRAMGRIQTEVIDFDHRDLALRLMLHGRCVGLFPHDVVAPYVDAGSAVVICPELDISTTIHAVWLKSNERMVAIRKLTSTIDPTVT